jgi:hypothetical protein
LFADAECSHPVIPDEPDECGRTGTYFVERGGPAGCLAPQATVYTLGAKIDPPPQLYNHNAGLCVTTTRSAAAGFNEAVPSDSGDWVELADDVVPVTDALAVVNWEGADGSRIPIGLQLLSSGRACEPYPDDISESQVRCVTVPRANLTVDYADAQCSGEQLGASCQPTDVIDIIPNTSASQTYAGAYGLFQTGAPASIAYFRNPFDGNKCVLLSGNWRTESDASYFFAIGPPLEVERYPSLTRVSEGSGRLRIRYLTSEGKDLLPELFYDSKYGQSCTAMQLSDGGTWCVPGPLEFDTERGNFMDPECTRLAAYVPPEVGGSSSPAEPYRFGLVLPQGHTCNSARKPVLYSIAERTGPMFFRSSTGTCTQGGPPNPGERIFEAVAPLDPAVELEPVPELP